MSNWKDHYNKNPKRYCWELMWDTSRSTGNIVHPHPKLYAGDCLSAIPAEVIAVVNVASERKNHPGVRYVDHYKVGLPDPGEHTADFHIFSKAVLLVKRLIVGYNYVTFVHCASGMSRSIAVAAAAAAVLNQSKVIEEIKKIAKIRPEIYPELCYVIFGEMLNGEFPE